MPPPLLPLPLLPLTLSPWLLPTLALVAFLYATVGHAGASGYIAVLALAGLPAALIKPLALLLNLVVAAQGSWQFWRAGHLRGSLLWPLLASGMPAAFLGGWLDLPTEWFQRLVALVLLASALRFLRQPRDPERLHTPPLPLLLLSGAGLGLLAGLTGTGGGVFLTPLLLLAAWATTRQAAAVSSLFILVNSFSGLMGLLLARQGIGLAPAPQLGWLLLTVLLAGGLGSRLGSRHWPVSWIRRVLALVLLLAAWKLLGFAG
jgi:uncharacterized membrane protein YfcA